MAAEKLLFNPSQGYTLGVEVEFQIIDKESFSLAPLGPRLEKLAPDLLKPRISQELIASILEIQTDICSDLRGVADDLHQTISLAEELADVNGCFLYASSLHPFAIAAEQELSHDARYRRIMDELQIVGRRFISQGLHVHVGVPDGDAAARVCNTIQPFLPLFLALTSSSPFFQGRDTGLMSYRTKLFESLPLAGMYEEISSWNNFSTEVGTLIKHGIIETVKDLWWDARPSPGFGTVEIRVCDLPTRFRDILSVVAFIQACVIWIVEEKIDIDHANRYIMKANKWQAVRYGLSGTFIDPTGIISHSAGDDIAAAVRRLVEIVLPYATEEQGHSHFKNIERIVDQGTGADMQKTIYKDGGSFKDVINSCHRGFWK